MDMIHVRPADHVEAVTIEAVILEANEAIVYGVRTHRRVAVVF